MGARPGLPRGGSRMALIDTLRAAVPWQALRRRETPGRDGLIVRKGDIRIRRFEEKASSVTLFCVDASGSAAACVCRRKSDSTGRVSSACASVRRDIFLSNNVILHLSVASEDRCVPLRFKMRRMAEK